MLYYLFTYLDKLDVPGAGLFNYITFRAAMGFLSALLISLIWGKKIIRLLQKKQIGETVRDLGLDGQIQKAGTPTMGGIIIILSIVIPILLFAKVLNVYILLMLLTTIWLGTIGFLDDYIKVFKKKKEGLKGKYKLVAQLGLGFIVALVILTSPEISVIHFIKNDDGTKVFYQKEKTLETTLPFVKENTIDYAKILDVFNADTKFAEVLLYTAIVIFIIMAVSNGVNLTDGLDGLAAGTSAVSAGVLGIFAYVSGNILFAEYLKIMFIQNVGEMFVFMATFMGAIIGFLWYNSYPAQVFMGDTGSLTLGGIIAVAAILVRKEWLLPLFGGIFLIETLSVMIQVTYFKYTKRKYGEGRRIFLMSPLHHHYQKKGVPEPKIVARFVIVAIFLAVLSVVTLKIR